MEKAELRKLVKARVVGMSAGDREFEESRIWEQVESLPEFSAASTVLAYMSLPDEVGSAAIVDKWHRAGKRVVLPRVVSESEMELRAYDPSNMVKGAYGISEPGDGCAPVDTSLIEFAIVPGVAFDKSGMRLGRGKGYYDRMLPSLNCPVAGICYSVSFFEKVPSAAWDVPVNKVIVGNI